jgi:protein-serine/threonine kinase
MLAGYLPFDDDPANPEGDNINLLYKYIVSTPLTFPEYVTPHARDLLRRILVPDPRKRADLFEVARHSWLSPFADIVSKVTSATTGIMDVETVTVNGLFYFSSSCFTQYGITNTGHFLIEPKPGAPSLARSASVREPPSTSHGHGPSALGTRHHAHEQLPQPTQPKASADAKRRTVQVEYVEPKSQTKRGSAVDPDQEPSRRRGDSEDVPPPVVPTHKDGGVQKAATSAGNTNRTFSKFMDKQRRESSSQDPKLPGPEKGKTRPVSYQYQQSTAASRAGVIAEGQVVIQPSRRPSRDRGGHTVPGRPVGPSSGDSGTRPNTANSLASTRLPSRGSYSRPVAPSVAANTAQGKIAMPKGGKPYQISHPIPQSDSTGADFTPIPRVPNQPEQHPKGHKRANTVGSGATGESGRFLGKIMGNSERPGTETRPVAGRQSFEQGRKVEKSSTGPTKTRRFSLLPQSFSLRSISGSESRHERKLSRNSSRQYGNDAQAQQNPQVQSQPQLAVSNNDNASAFTGGSDTSLAAGSAPASAFAGSSVEVGRKTTLAKHKKFGDAYEGEVNSGGHGSSGAARRVMDFFRRRGAARSKNGGV